MLAAAASIDALRRTIYERNFQFRLAAEFIKLLRSLHCLPSGHRLWHNLCVENEIMPTAAEAQNWRCVLAATVSNSLAPFPAIPLPSLLSSLTVVRSSPPNVSIKAQIKLQTTMGNAYKKVGVAGWVFGVIDLLFWFAKDCKSCGMAAQSAALRESQLQWQSVRGC